jgi:diaminopimelate decarboxylase
MAGAAGTTAANVARDGEAWLPRGFFSAYPDLVAERERFAPLLRRIESPFFLADTRVLADRLQRLRQALEQSWGRSAVAYSFKTNYAVAGSRALQERGAWAEVVSGREYGLARRLGFGGDRIIFNGPLKRDDELRDALRDGALIHVNDLEELERLLGLLTERPSGARIGIRVNAEVSGQPPSRFGLSLERGEAQAAVERILSVPGLALAGLHLHLRGDTDDPAVYREAARRLAAFITDGMPAHLPAGLSSLDLGGGFPAHGPKPRSRARWDPRPIEDYVEAIAAELAPAFAGGARPTLILEPGRYLVADAIVFVAEVLGVRRSAGLQDVTCTGAVTMLPLTHYCPQIVRVYAPDLTPRDGAPERSLVFGSSCRENDVLYEGPLPPVSRGDHLVFYAVGAYNSSLSPEFIFEAPPVVFA